MKISNACRWKPCPVKNIRLRTSGYLSPGIKIEIGIEIGIGIGIEIGIEIDPEKISRQNLFIT